MLHCTDEAQLASAVHSLHFGTTTPFFIHNNNVLSLAIKILNVVTSAWHESNNQEQKLSAAVPDGINSRSNVTLEN